VIRRSLALAASSLIAFAFAALGLLPVAPAARADSIRDREYWLDEYGITKAWEVSKGAGVTVAVIDSGVDGTHPDLRGVVVGGHDSSGAGTPDGQKPLGAKPEHGTLVATMLAGRGHSSAPQTGTQTAPQTQAQTGAAASGGPDGVVGVAPEARLLTASTWLGSANPAGRTDIEQIPDAVRWAVDQGAKVINISLGSSSPVWPQSWDAAFLYAEQRDAVVVAAAGNRLGGNVQVGAPATIPGVLTVAGLDRQGAASIDSSSQGISIGVAAPAEQLVGGLPGGQYAEWAGTSGAAPIVSGVAALIRSKWPQMSAAQVINRIVATAKDAGTPGTDPIYGHGILDAAAALTAEVPEVSSNPLGSIADWIRVHRKGAAAPSAPSAQAGAPAGGTAGGDPASVPIAEPSPPAPHADQAESPWPAVTVLGSAGVVLAVAAGGALHVARRASRERDTTGPSR
jgi:subtilisin family serine protease